MSNKTTLKTLAKGALHRMKKGYADETPKDKSLLPSMEQEENRIYKKIIEMSSENDVFNPLGRLVDHKIYDILSETQKEKYVLNLSKTYLKVLDRYPIIKKQS